MNINTFEGLSNPWQNPSEWFLFLNFVESYFLRRNLVNPVVVELGVFENKQKPFYTALGARHIGIDNSVDLAFPDILGDTSDPSTVSKLLAMLGGGGIDVLFVDACHQYEAVKKDYETYSPLVTGMIALHDVFNHKYGVEKFWNDLIHTHTGMEGNTFVTIHAKEGFANHGIGIVVRQEGLVATTPSQSNHKGV